MATACRSRPASSTTPTRTDVDGVGDLVAGALRLDPAAFTAIASDPAGLRIAVLVLIGSALSHVLGQSVALVANRVPPWRFVLSIALGTAIFAASVGVWAGALTVAGALAFDRPTPFAQVIRIVGLAHAPRLFGFVVLTPYFGAGIGVALTVWTFLALAVGARATFGFSLPEALVALGAAWLVTELLARTVGRPVVAATRRIRERVAGRHGPDGAERER